MEELILCVKATNNYPLDLPRQTFQLLSAVWSGPSLTLSCKVATAEEPSPHEITGWTDVFCLGPCPIQVAKVRAQTGRVGYLIYGGSAGLRVLDKQEGPPPSGDDYLPPGYGLPFLWIDLEDKDSLPEEVWQTVQ